METKQVTVEEMNEVWLPIDGYCGIYDPNKHLNNYGAEVDIKTVGQFTNLIDKAGNKIFEGDIVNHWNRLYEVAINFNGYYLQRYKLWRGKFVPSYHYALSLITKPSKNRFGGEVDSAEIVGNIYDNPELISKIQSET